ncbi:MAG TPA: hypothetical protein VGC62_05525 [Pseudomonas sp.]|uniref:hypothetical protein n=1 Tax=Pseudomonas sp. TaxID=306 RepID=UPI002ED88A18
MGEVVTQPDNKIFVVGNMVDSRGNQAGCVYRLLSDGSLDLAFGQGAGRVLLEYEGYDWIQPMALCLDPETLGKIVIAGAVMGNPPKGAVVRLNEDGGLDQSFNNGKFFINRVGNVGNQNMGVVVDSGGLIVVAGTTLGQAVFTVVCLRPDGTSDTDFGRGGQITIDFPDGIDLNTNIQIQGDGNIVVSGMCLSSGIKLCGARILMH